MEKLKTLVLKVHVRSFTKKIHNAILRYRKIFIVSRTFHVYSQECSVKRQKLRFYLQIYVLICESLFLLTD